MTDTRPTADTDSGPDTPLGTDEWLLATADNAVRRVVMVTADRERAFEVFTAGMASWWPADHHLVDELDELVFEPWVGGGVIDRATDGTECRWARVLAYEPPDRLVLSWDIDPAWQVETDPDRTSEVEVGFLDDGAGGTEVRLEHRNLDRHGDGWESMRSAIGSADGWDLVLGGFVATVG